MPDAPNWLNGGELVLTTMINLPTDPAEQEQYIQAMADKGVAGLALAVGRYVDRAPDNLREVAELNHFPLIEIPYQARFVDIARATNERISQEEHGDARTRADDSPRADAVGARRRRPESAGGDAGGAGRAVDQHRK